jgi:methionyl-tRNA formyltransferase
LKIVIFVRQHDARLERLVVLLEDAGIPLAGAVVETGLPKKKRKANSKWQVLLSDFSGMTILEKLLHSYSVIARRTARSFGKSDRKSKSIYDDAFRATDFLAVRGIPYVAVFNHSSEETCEFLIRNGIRTAFLLSGGIIKNSILGLEDFEMFVAHPAILPKHRSLGSMEWSVLEGDALGHTVFRIDAGIDTGPVAFHRFLEPSIDDTLETFRHRLFLAVPDLYSEAAELLRDGKLILKPQNLEDGVHHSRPIKALVMRAEKLLRARARASVRAQT